MNDILTTGSIRFVFAGHVPHDNIEGTLHLSRLATESLFGPGRFALDARYHFDRARRFVEVDDATEIGRSLALIFGGYAVAEFGNSAVQMQRRPLIEPVNEPQEVA